MSEDKELRIGDYFCLQGMVEIPRPWWAFWRKRQWREEQWFIVTGSR